MSKENVALFIKAANKKAELSERVAKTGKTGDWVKIAKDAGFEFTADEFSSVVGETIKKKVTADNAVSEYLAARQTMGSGELNNRVLDSVVGGRAPRHINLPPMFINLT